MKRERKQNREKSGDPGQPEYKGPWADYEGMEEFKHQETAKLTEEQTETIEKYQNMIKDRLENTQDASKKKPRTTAD